MDEEKRLKESILHTITWLYGEGFDMYKPMPASQCHKIADILMDVLDGKTTEQAITNNQN